MYTHLEILTTPIPVMRSLYWLPVPACIKFKTLILAYIVKYGPAPSSLRALLTPCTALRSRCSSCTARLIPPSLEAKARSASRLIATLFDEVISDQIQNQISETLGVFEQRPISLYSQLLLNLYLIRSGQCHTCKCKCSQILLVKSCSFPVTT